MLIDRKKSTVRINYLNNTIIFIFKDCLQTESKQNVLTLDKKMFTINLSWKREHDVLWTVRKKLRIKNECQLSSCQWVAKLSRNDKFTNCKVWTEYKCTSYSKRRERGDGNTAVMCALKLDALCPRRKNLK